MDATLPRGASIEPLVGDHLARLSADHLRRLLGVSHVFNSTVDLDELIPRVLELVLEVVGAEAGSIWLLDDDAVRCAYALGPAADRMEGLELPAGAGLVGDAVARCRPSLVLDAASDPRFLHQIDEATGFETRSILTVPLLAPDASTGAIQVVNSTDGKPFDQEDLDFLVALADDAAAGIRNARLVEAELRARDLKALLSISHEITGTFDLDRVLVSVVNLAGRAIPFRRCVLALVEDERLRVRAISGEAAVDRKSAAVREIERLLDWIAEGRDRLHVAAVTDDDDPAARELALKFPDYIEASGAGSLLVLPIDDADGRLGLILFEFAEAGQPTEWGTEAAELLANETALALRNAQLYRDVPFIGWLEPLANRRRALAALPAAAWIRYGAIALGLLLILTVVRLPLRVGAATSSVRAAVQMPARAGIGGIIEEIMVREGQPVEPGQPLARLRDDALLQRVRDAEARAALADRDAMAAEARGDALAGALARVRGAEAADALELLRRQLDQGLVRAPVAGVVLTSRLEERVGGRIEPGGPLLLIGSPGWSEIELRVAQADIGEVRVGDRVRAKVPAHPAVTFEGRVASVSPATEMLDGAPVYTARALLDNREGLLLPGMEARARIHTRDRPLAALLFRRPWRWIRLKLWW